MSRAEIVKLPAHASRRCYDCSQMYANWDYYDGHSFGCQKYHWSGSELERPSDFRDALERAAGCDDFEEREA